MLRQRKLDAQQRNNLVGLVFVLAMLQERRSLKNLNDVSGLDANFHRSISQQTSRTHSTLCVDSRLNMVETVIPNFCTIDLRTSSDTIGGIIAVLSYWKKVWREEGRHWRGGCTDGEREGERKREEERWRQRGEKESTRLVFPAGWTTMPADKWASRLHCLPDRHGAASSRFRLRYSGPPYVVVRGPCRPPTPGWGVLDQPDAGQHRLNIAASSNPRQREFPRSFPSFLFLPLSLSLSFSTPALFISPSDFFCFFCIISWSFSYLLLSLYSFSDVLPFFFHQRVYYAPGGEVPSREKYRNRNKWLSCDMSGNAMRDIRIMWTGCENTVNYKKR